jgi:hypothetical protein
MTRDRLEEAFLRLRAAGDADEYVPMEDVIEVVLEKLRLATAVVDEARTLYGEGRGRPVETPVSEDGGFVRHDYLIPAEWIDIGLGCALAALGAVPGDDE